MPRRTKYETDLFSDNSDLFSDSDCDVELESSSKSSRSSKSKKEHKEPKEHMEHMEETNPKRRNKKKEAKETCRTPRTKSAYLAVNKHFQNAFKTTSATGDSDAFKYLLKKTPVPAVLHHLHFLFDINRGNSSNTRLLVAYNDKFNIVSRYFLKAMKADDRASSAMSSLADVSKKISKKTSLNEIDNLLHFTPEFILMTTIQAGDMKNYDKIVSEWELMDGFKGSCDLIAAFFGVRKFFSDSSRFVSRQALVISCICGGSVETLEKIVKNTDTKWLSDFTMRKSREMCTPPEAMLGFLEETYGLKI